MRWFVRRRKLFENPVPLPNDLNSLVGKVAALRPFKPAAGTAGAVDSAVCGYLSLERTVFARLEREDSNSTSTTPREVIEMNLVTLLEDTPSEYLQDYYDSSDAAKELLSDRLRLYGHWYRLDWLDGEDRERVLQHYFRE